MSADETPRTGYEAVEACWYLVGITAMERFTAMAIARHHAEHGCIWPSMSRLAWFTGLGKSTVRGYVSSLAAKRLIERVERPGVTTVYRLTFENAERRTPPTFRRSVDNPEPLPNPGGVPTGDPYRILAGTPIESWRGPLSNPGAEQAIEQAIEQTSSSSDVTETERTFTAAEEERVEGTVKRIIAMKRDARSSTAEPIHDPEAWEARVRAKLQAAGTVTTICRLIGEHPDWPEQRLAAVANDPNSTDSSPPPVELTPRQREERRVLEQCTICGGSGKRPDHTVPNPHPLPDRCYLIDCDHFTFEPSTDVDADLIAEMELHWNLDQELPDDCAYMVAYRIDPDTGQWLYRPPLPGETLATVAEIVAAAAQGTSR